MRSRAGGKNISNAEVTNISATGIWLIFDENEYFLPYTEFPWFRDAKVSEILNLTIEHSKHLRWSTLDIDLDLDMLKNLEKYPLVFH